MGGISQEDLAAGAAQVVISRLDAKYQLIYVAYDDQLRDEQIQKLFAGEEDDIPDAEWESDARWNSVRAILDDLLDEDARTTLDQLGALDEVCDAIHERDTSDSIGDLMRNTHPKLMRFRLDFETEGDPCRHSDEENDTAARALGGAAEIDWETNADALRELVASACFGGSLYVLWRGPVAPVYQAVCEARWKDPAPEIVVQWIDPELLVLDQLNGSGHAVTVKGTVRVTFDPDRLSLDGRSLGGGYSWADTVADDHYHPNGGEAQFIYPPAPNAGPTPPRLALTRYGEPRTFKHARAEDLVGRLLHARPYYHVPAGRSCLISARSPWTVPVYINSASFGDALRGTIHHDFKGPWLAQQSFYVRELHMDDCGCAACCGDGIHRLHGA
jgi:hypothetical protein